MRASPRRVLILVLVVVVLGAAILYGLLARRVVWSDAERMPPPLSDAIEAFAAGNLERGIQAIEQALATYRAPAWESRMRVLAAVKLAAANRHDRIPRFLPEGLPDDDPLVSWADLLRARALLARGRAGDAARAAARAASMPEHPWHEEALRVQVSALEADHRAKEALVLLDRESDPSLRFEAAKVAERAGDREEARSRLARLVLDAPSGDGAERAADALASLVPSASARFRDAERKRLPAAAERWGKAGRFSQGLDLLRSSRSIGSEATVSPDECLIEADLEVRLGLLPRCAGVLARTAAGHGEPAEAARYLTARADELRGSRGAYRSGLESLARTGRSRFRLEALLDLAQLAEGAPSATALAAYRRYREAAGSAAEAVAVWREAWIALELGKGGEADQGIARALSKPDAPDSVRMAALYWSGKRQEAAGNRAAALTRYRETASKLPNHYYGMLAARRLGLPSPSIPLDPPPAAATGTAGRLLAAARELRSVGLSDLAIGAYRAAALAAPGSRLPIALEGADYAVEAKATAEATQLVQLASGGKDSARLSELPLRHLRLLVPAPWGKEIVSSARAARLDPWLVASVALEESAFNPGAVSRVGARGLLQLMPETGAELARGLGIRGFGPERLFEPGTNLRLGCIYLRGLVDRLDSVPAALAAYNAGGTRAARWATPSDGTDDGERYVERIPVSDTRSYVKRILANVRLYRLAWPDGLDAARR